MIPKKVQHILDQHGLQALEFEEGSTPTVATAAAKIGVMEGQIAKSLLFKGISGTFYLLVCAGNVYPAAGNDATGVPVSYEELRDITGGRSCEVTQDGSSL